MCTSLLYTCYIPQIYPRLRFICPMPLPAVIFCIGVVSRATASAKTGCGGVEDRLTQKCGSRRATTSFVGPGGGAGGCAPGIRLALVVGLYQELRAWLARRRRRRRRRRARSGGRCGMEARSEHEALGSLTP